jgi:hypothetical protein
MRRLIWVGHAWFRALLVGVVVAAVTLAFLGVDTYCDKTPPCPPGASCILIKIAGLCGVTWFNVAAAVLIGAAAAGVFVAVARTRQRGLPRSTRDPLVYGALAIPLGVLYGYLSLEALSGIAPAVLVEVVGVTLLARRIPHVTRAVLGATVGFMCGFAGAWVALLAGRPYCCGAGADALRALGFMALALLPAFVVWRATRSRSAADALTESRDGPT